MTAALTKNTLHQKLLRDSISGELTEADTLLWMVLLHTHAIHLCPDAVPSANGAALVCEALTQRHAADVVAGLWQEFHPGDSEKASYTYWYRRYNTETAYEVFDDVPEQLRIRLVVLRDVLSRDSRISAITPED